jgi:hypothetical protein
MDSYTKKFWAVVQDKIGSVSELIEPIGKQIRLPIDQNDIEGARARAHEIKEAGVELTATGDVMLKILEDGTVDVVEGAEFIVQFEKLIDETEDIVTGVDEDDAPKDVPVTAKKATVNKKK